LNNIAKEVHFMNTMERRKAIVERLTATDEPVNATRLAGECGVTRQIIVADVALLRAEGYPIRAEHRGYVIEKKHGGRMLFSIVCRHSRDEISDEFYSVVDNGGEVLDVTVDHTVYGTISVDLRIASRFDADEFVEKAKNAAASQLSDLTGGLHAHTVAVHDEKAFERICAELTAKGILVDRT
jgi:transcriptional regulator of NAD metabolism